MLAQTAKGVTQESPGDSAGGVRHIERRCTAGDDPPLGRQFESAARKGDVKEMDRLLRSGVDLNATLYGKRSVAYCALYHAVSGAKKAAVRRLYELDVPLPCGEQWVTDALCAAANNGDLKMIRLLVAGGADFMRAGSDGSTPLARAIRKSHMPVVAYLEASLREA
jgi:hypothetical protein